MFQRRIAALLVVATLFLTVWQPAFAATALPGSNFAHKFFYETASYIPDCIKSSSCALFVDPINGKDEDDGSKEKPFKSLVKALENVTSSKNHIAVAAGTVDGNSGNKFPLQPFAEVFILGGFYDSFSKRDNSRATNKSIISTKAVGVNSGGETAFIVGSSNFLIDGFEFRDGDLTVGVNSESGAALQIQSFGKDVSILNSDFVGNSAQKGGAIDVRGKSGSVNNVLIAGNTFRENKTKSSVGGAIYATGGATIFSNKFEKNSAEDEGGAIYATGDTVIVGNLFIENGLVGATNSGAVTASDNVGVYNNFFIADGNKAAVYATGSARFAHNTVVRAKNAGVLVGSNDVWVGNNLFAHSGAKAISPLVLAISGYKNEGNLEWQNSGVSKDVVSCDPKFADKDSKDPVKLKIGAGSDCIDKAVNYSNVVFSSYVQRDYFGGERNLDGNKDSVAGFDPGAHEIEGDKGVVGAEAKKPEVTDLKIVGDQMPAKITFQLSDKANVSVTVFTKTGTEVRRLYENKSLDKGLIEILWDQQDKTGFEVDYGKYDLKITALSSLGQSDLTKEFELMAIGTAPKEEVKEEIEEETKTEESTSSVGEAQDFAACAGFNDVVASAQLCEAIKYVKEKGYFQGYSDGSFGYERPISRAEVLKVVFLHSGQKILEDDGTNLGFGDLIKSEWYMPFVRTAKEFKIVQGYSDGTFKPAQAVKRNEFLKIFFLANEVALPSGVSKAPYPDVKVTTATEWFISFVEFARQFKLMDTDRAGNFLADSPMTRGDVAEFIYRFDKK
jgi:predicted outer membrane repeat protein